MDYIFMNKYFKTERKMCEWICMLYDLYLPPEKDFELNRFRSNDLRLCPFCCGESHIISDTRDGSTYVKCSKCSAKSIKNYPRKRIHVNDEPVSLHIVNYDYETHILVAMWNKRRSYGRKVKVSNK